jgi:hypothetical protein
MASGQHVARNNLLVEELEPWDPVDTYRLHVDSLDVPSLQPIGQGVKVLGKGGKAAHGLPVASRPAGQERRRFG